MDFAIIGGTGVYDPDMLENLREQTVDTPYGEAAVRIGGFKGRDVVFLNRHGAGHALPPHRVNYRANIWALRQLGVRRVLGTAAVGSLNPAMQPGDLVLADDFLDFTKSRVTTFFEGGEEGVVHVDVTEPYCPDLRAQLASIARQENLRCHDGGVYVCCEGPRFESPAEIRMFQRLGGDLVGMTNIPEVVLARELGLCYSLVCMVTNLAAGISATPLTHEEVLEVMAENGQRLRRLAMGLLERLPEAKPTCNCQPPRPM